MTQISTEQQAYLRHLKKHRMIVQFFRFFLLLLFLDSGKSLPEMDGSILLFSAVLPESFSVF